MPSRGRTSGGHAAAARRTSGAALTRALGLGLALAAATAAGNAHGGEPTVEEKAGARAAAEQGNSAFKAGKFVEALDLFHRAEALLHAPTHVLMIARTLLGLGQLVAAKEAFLQVSREALPASAPAPFKKAQVDARAELATLEPRIPTVQVTARGGGKRVEITMDGKPVPEALVGIARPVDPGNHVFRAASDGLQSDERKLVVQEKDHLAVVLELKAASATAPPVAPSPPTEPVTAPTSAPTIEPPPPQADGPSDPLMPISIVVTGVGVVGLGLGTVFALLARSARSDADSAYAKCGDPCPKGAQADEVQRLDDDATGKSTIAVISLIAGGALTATGIALFAVSSSSGGDPAKASPGAAAGKARSVTPWIGLGSAGVSGRF